MLSYFFLSYATTSLTAEPSKHYKAVIDQRLTFTPGEIYKDLEIKIVDAGDINENKSFQVTFSSPQKHVLLTSPRHVNVTIVYTKGKKQTVASPSYTVCCPISGLLQKP